MKYLFRLLLICILSFLLCGCNFKAQEPISKTGFYFDTVISITIYDSNDEPLLEQCFTHCEELENLLSRTIPTSDISRINSAAGAPVAVSDTTIELLKQGIYYGELTDGTFDITVAPLSDVWNFKENTGILPTEHAITEALSHVSYENIQIDGNTVTLTDPEAAIDLGGVAKGYIADVLKEFLKSKGVKSALIDLGGNILTLGSKPDGTAFQIGIKKPFDTKEVITSVSASDLSVVTSGSYERYFEVENVKYHHILDTKSGYPSSTGLLSVTILSKKSIEGDALSTSCFALGLEKGRSLIDSLEGIDAIFITEDYKAIDTRK